MDWLDLLAVQGTLKSLMVSQADGEWCRIRDLGRRDGEEFMRGVGNINCLDCSDGIMGGCSVSKLITMCMFNVRNFYQLYLDKCSSAFYL